MLYCINKSGIEISWQGKPTAKRNFHYTMLERESKNERVQKMGFFIKSRVQKTGMSIEIQCPK